MLEDGHPASSGRCAINLSLNLVASACVKSRLAADKYPRQVWLVESPPTGATGKILRREVKIPPKAGPA